MPSECDSTRPENRIMAGVVESYWWERAGFVERLSVNSGIESLNPPLQNIKSYPEISVG
ncbi:MAG: hypothetical protein RIM23_14470 [Coleofasciculus sp. G3-WIS-01]|uniref:hypothetical protein n=1 Tax=Coleofasciculus sp. G3-WIS-01 TaxID=3069528 RepID=UPI0032F133AB